MADKLNFVQAQMFRRMMKLKRIKNELGVRETWLEWHKRTLAKAYDTIKAEGVLIEHYVDNSRVTWSQHVSRFGLGKRPNHLLKKVVLCRSRLWWSFQKL